MTLPAERVVPAGFSVALILLVTVAVVSQRSIDRLNEEAAQVRGSQARLTELAGLLATVGSLSAAQHGYAVSGDESFLESIDRDMASGLAQISRVRELMAAVPAHRARLAELERLVTARMGIAAQVASLGKREGSDAAARATVAGIGLELDDGIRRVVGDLRTIQEAALAAGQQRARDSSRRALVTTIVSTVLAVLISAGAMFLVLRDMGARVRAQQALNAAKAALEEAKERAESADRLKSAFLATMSHELRTPLNSVIGFTGILLQELAGPINDEQKRQLEMVQGSARHLLALINDVLDISKIEAGQLTLERAPFDLRATVERVAASLRSMAEHKGLALRIDLSEAVGPAVGDRRRLEQVLLNLLNNAVKFTEQGEVSLSVMPDAAGPLVWFRVVDTGIGITSEDLSVLFQPFRQIDSGVSRQYDGTGLGLSICQRLVTLMGGKISVQSRRGEGTEFSFALPLRPEA